MNDNQTDYVARHGIMQLLSEEEAARVSTEGMAACLTNGDEYLDLEELHEGVRLAGTTTAPKGRVLLRRSVHESTWRDVLAQLSAYLAATAHFGVGRGTE